MKQIKIIVGVSVAVAVVLLGIGGCRMARSFSAAAAARDQRDLEFGRLEALFSAKPFPDAANAEAARRDTASLTEMRRSLAEALSAGNVPTEDLSPSLFIQALQDSLRNTLQAKAPIVDGARVVADNFAFGFDRYQGAGAPMPSIGDVPRLAQQLAIVEKLVAEVYAAQVGSLRVVRRDEFDGGAAAAAAPEDGRRAARRDRGPAAPAGGLVTTPLYDSQHFTLEVSGREPAISELLNRLADMDVFVIVSEVSLRKRAEDVRPAPAPEGSPATTGATAPAATAPAAGGSAKVSTLSPSQRLMSGPEIDPPLDARIELDVYNFHIKGV